MSDQPHRPDSGPNEPDDAIHERPVAPSAADVGARDGAAAVGAGAMLDADTDEGFLGYSDAGDS